MAETTVRQSRSYPKRGEPMRHLLAHMWDDCPRWPYARGKRGYGHIQHGGKVVDVHRLVCELAHGPPPSPAHDAAHSCGKGHEGCFGARCLSWKTKVENRADSVRHGTMSRGSLHPISRLTEAQVQEIRRLRGQLSQTQIAARFSVSRGAIADIHTGRKWRWLPSP